MQRLSKVTGVKPTAFSALQACEPIYPAHSPVPRTFDIGGAMLSPRILRLCGWRKSRQRSGQEVIAQVFAGHLTKGHGGLKEAGFGAAVVALTAIEPAQPSDAVFAADFLGDGVGQLRFTTVRLRPVCLEVAQDTGGQNVAADHGVVGRGLFGFWHFRPCL